KTTTIRTLRGFQSPTEGTATVLGADIREASALREVRANGGYLPSEPVSPLLECRRTLDRDGRPPGPDRRPDRHGAGLRRVNP
ncbi:MAG: hypothetical protein V5A33_04680, partial [Halobacteriales archaeon]